VNPADVQTLKFALKQSQDMCDEHNRARQQVEHENEILRMRLERQQSEHIEQRITMQQHTTTTQSITKHIVVNNGNFFHDPDAHQSCKEAEARIRRDMATDCAQELAKTDSKWREATELLQKRGKIGQGLTRKMHQAELDKVNRIVEQLKEMCIRDYNTISDLEEQILQHKQNPQHYKPAQPPPPQSHASTQTPPPPNATGAQSSPVGREIIARTPPPPNATGAQTSPVGRENLVSKTAKSGTRLPNREPKRIINALCYYYHVIHDCRKAETCRFRHDKPATPDEANNILPPPLGKASANQHALSPFAPVGKSNTQYATTHLGPPPIPIGCAAPESHDTM